MKPEQTIHDFKNTYTKKIHFHDDEKGISEFTEICDGLTLKS